MRSFVGAAIVVLMYTAPGWAQVYGPDGKELPPVPDKPSTSSASQPASTATPYTATWHLTESSFRRPKRFGITVGGFYPINALADHSASGAWPSLMFSYEWRQPSPKRPYSMTAYFESAANSRTFRDEFQNRMNEVREMYGLGLEMRSYVHPMGRFALYLGAGAGGYYLRRGVRYDTADSPFLFFNDRTLISGKYYMGPGYKLLFGAEERHGIFAELRYLDAGSLEGVRYQGISANIGGKF